MATYTTRNRLVKQAQNENKNTWGTVLNNGAIELIDFSADGIASKALSADAVLTSVNGAADEARARTILITSTGGSNRIVTIPAVEKWYNVINDGANQVTVKTAAGTGVIVPANTICTILCDGTNCRRLNQRGPGLLLTRSYTDFSGGLLIFDLRNYGCDNFEIKVKGASVNNTDAAALVLRLSTDGSTWTTGAGAQFFDFGASATSTGYGSVHLRNVKDAVGTAHAGVANLTANTTTALGLVGINYRLTGPVNYAAFTQTTGGAATLDAGTFELWGG